MKLLPFALLTLCAACSAQRFPEFAVRTDGLLIDAGPREPQKNCVRRLNVWQGQRTVFESHIYHSCARYIFVRDAVAIKSKSEPFVVELMFDSTPQGQVVFARDVAG